MIDMQKVENTFNEYVEQYDMQNGKIKLKFEHIKRVSKNSMKIATGFNLSKEEIDLARIDRIFT